MAGAPVTTEPWFSADQQAALVDYWNIYEAHYDAISARSLADAKAIPAFGPIIDAMTPEALASQRAKSRDLLRRGIHGEWAAYEAHLLAQGAMYAHMGVGFRAWHDLVRSYVHHVTPLLVEAYVAEPARLTGALLAMQDMLDRAMAVLAESYLDTKEAAVRASEENLATTLDSIGDAVIATDANGNIVRMNPVAESLTGWPLADCIGRPLADVFVIQHEWTAVPVESPVDRVLREGCIVGLANHTALVRRDGTRCPIADSGAPIRGANGEVRGVVLVFRDMTAEQRTAVELQRWEELFRHAGWGVAVVSVEGERIELANPSFAAMHGYTVEETLALPAQDLMPEDERAGAPERRAIADSTGHYVAESTRLRKDGTTFPVLIDITPVRNQAGAVIYRAVAIQDITDRKRLEEIRIRAAELEADSRRANAANRLKSEFLANMSHELRTPLNSIIGFSELIYDGEILPEMPQYKEFLSDILKSARHLLRLINDVLDLSKVEAGKVDFHPEHVHIGQLVEEVQTILKTTAVINGMRLVAEVDPSLTGVVADPGRLKQILYNYVSNAIKFTPRGGTVTIRARSEGVEHFRLEVEDTGYGIAATDLSKLFVEFQQLDSSVAKQHSGTGLGLALTKKLVEAQEGVVGVHSVVGRGSVFHAVLPRKARVGTPAFRSMSLPGAHAAAPVVLVVEDDEADQLGLVAALSGAGYAVDTASSAAEAMDKCHQRVYDAITLDLILRDGSGLGVLRQVRAETKNAQTPVIIVTVLADKGTASAFAVHDALAKPLDANALLASLRAAGVAPTATGPVLVVEDDAASGRLMVAALQQHGYASVCAADGQSGLDMAAKSPPSAVILDLLMPRIDGFEFLTRFRELKGCRQVPVIIWTVKDLTPADRHRLAAAQRILPKSSAPPGVVLDELRALRVQPDREG